MKIVNLGVILVCIDIYPPFYYSFLRAKYEQKLEPVQLVFTPEGAIVSRRIKGIHTLTANLMRNRMVIFAFF